MAATLLFSITLLLCVHAQANTSAGSIQNNSACDNSLFNTMQETDTNTSSIPGDSTLESNAGEGYRDSCLGYPAWAWMKITWEYPNPYSLMIPHIGFSWEETQAIIDSNYAQPIVDSLFEKHSYFGHDISDFYNGQDVSLMALVRDYWNGIPMEATMYELRKEKEKALKLAASLPASKNSPCLSELTKDKEGALAAAIASLLFHDSSASCSSLWKNNTSGAEGLELVLPENYAPAKFYSISNGIVMRTETKVTKGAVAIFNPANYLSYIYGNYYALLSASTGKIITLGSLLGYAGGNKTVFIADSKGNYCRDNNGNYYKVPVGTGNYKQVIARSVDDSKKLALPTAIHFEVHEGYNKTDPAKEGSNNGLSPYLCLNENQNTTKEHSYTVLIACIPNNNQWEYILRCTCGKTHTFTKVEGAKYQPCVSEEVEKFTCDASCNIIGLVTIPADNHNWSDWEPSKSGDGSTERRCNKCGKSESISDVYH